MSSIALIHHVVIMPSRSQSLHGGPGGEARTTFVRTNPGAVSAISSDRVSLVQLDDVLDRLIGLDDQQADLRRILTLRRNGHQAER